jgi:hypothetical protein
VRDKWWVCCLPVSKRVERRSSYSLTLGSGLATSCTLHCISAADSAASVVPQHWVPASGVDCALADTGTACRAYAWPLQVCPMCQHMWLLLLSTCVCTQVRVRSHRLRLAQERDEEGASRSWQCDRVHCRTTSQRRHSSRHLLPVPLPSTSADKIALHFSQLIVGLPSTQVALTWHFLRPQLKLMYADPCLRALSPFGIPTVCSLAAPPVVEARNVRDLLPTFRVLFEIG